MADPILSHVAALKSPHGNAYQSALVVQAGKTYALTVLIESVYAVAVTEITDPANPVIRNLVGWGDLDGSGVSREGGFVYGLAVNAAGTRAYVTGQGKVVELDISALPAVALGVTYDTGHPTVGATFLTRDGNVLFASLAGVGVYALDISVPGAITGLRFTGPAASDDGRYQPVSNVAVVGGTHVLSVATENLYTLLDVTTVASGFIRLCFVHPVPAVTSTQVSSSPEKQAGAAHLTSTRLYTVEGNASPPAGMNGLNRCTVYVRSLDASEGGSLSAPLLLGHSPFLEAAVIGLLEITRSGRRYLVCTCSRAWFTQTVQGQPGAFSGRTLVILDVEDPAQISVAATFGPPFAGSLLDYADPPYESYSTVMSGTTAVTANYGYGLLLTDLADLAHPSLLSRVLLSGEGRWLVRRGTLLAVADAISTFRLYSLADPEAPAFLGNYYSSSQCYQGCLELPTSAPGYVFCAGITSAHLEGVNIQDTAHPALDNILTLPFAISGMAADMRGGATLVVWGFTGNNPAFALVDIADPQHPRILCSRLSEAVGEVRCSKCLLDGDTLYFSTWGTADGAAVTGGGFRTYDVTDRANPVRLYGPTPGGPILIADMALLASGARRFLVTVPRWDATPTDLVLLRGGLWCYEVTDRAAPVSMARDAAGSPVTAPLVTHQALLNSSNQPCIFGGLASLPPYLVAGEYYQGVQPIDASRADAVRAEAPLQYHPRTQFTFCTLAYGLRLYAQTISDLHVYDATVPAVPAGGALVPDGAAAVFARVLSFGRGKDALTAAWLEVLTYPGAARQAAYAGADLVNLGTGDYGVPRVAFPPGLDPILLRAHSGEPADQVAEEIVNLSDFQQAVR